MIESFAARPRAITLGADKRRYGASGEDKAPSSL